MDKLNRAIYIKWYIKDKKGARKRIYNKADNTGTFIALYLADILVKHRQVNPYTDIHGGKIIGSIGSHMSHSARLEVSA